MIVQQGLPEVHPKTGARILAWNIVENDQNTILQTHSKSNINKPNGIHCWQLVCADDGIKLIEGVSLPSDGGGVEPTKIGPNPISSYLSYCAGANRNQSAFHIAYPRRCRHRTHLVHFIFHCAADAANILAIS
jgi:hypothetical protein